MHKDGERNLAVIATFGCPAWSNMHPYPAKSLLREPTVRVHAGERHEHHVGDGRVNWTEICQESRNSLLLGASSTASRQQLRNLFPVSLVIKYAYLFPWLILNIFYKRWEWRSPAVHCYTKRKQIYSAHQIINKLSRTHLISLSHVNCPLLRYRHLPRIDLHTFFE